MILQEGREEGRKEGLEEGLEKGIKKGKKEGAVEEAIHVLRFLGQKKFGAPAPRTIRGIDQLDDLQRIEELLERIITANSWDELLPPPARGQRRSE